MQTPVLTPQLERRGGNQSPARTPDLSGMAVLPKAATLGAPIWGNNDDSR